MERKLGRPTDQRMAIIKNQASELLWYGQIKTTVQRAETKQEKESKSQYKARTKAINHPLTEKIFNEYAPKYAEKNSAQTQGGGYTRIIKLGARRGDNAEMALLELV